MLALKVKRVSVDLGYCSIMIFIITFVRGRAGVVASMKSIFWRSCNNQHLVGNWGKKLRISHHILPSHCYFLLAYFISFITCVIQPFDTSYSIRFLQYLVLFTV